MDGNATPWQLSTPTRRIFDRLAGKTRMKLVIGSVLALSVPAAAEAAPWRYLNLTSMGGIQFVVYGDAASVRTDADGTKTMTVKYILWRYPDPGRRAMDKVIRYDCRAHRLKLIHVTWFSEAGAVVDDHPSADPWQDVDPKTTGAAELKAACQGYGSGNPAAADPFRDADRRMLEERIATTP
jgi:hypothetical protein